jgi:hypothetical protein
VDQPIVVERVVSRAGIDVHLLLELLRLRAIGPGRLSRTRAEARPDDVISILGGNRKVVRKMARITGPEQVELHMVVVLARVDAHLLEQRFAGRVGQSDGDRILSRGGIDEEVQNVSRWLLGVMQVCGRNEDAATEAGIERQEAA